MAAPPGFEEFVAFRSTRLLRAAYQLTHDWALAEDLTQAALAKAWRAWSRLSGEADPEPYVRKITYASWWRQPDRRHLANPGSLAHCRQRHHGQYRGVLGLQRQRLDVQHRT